MLVRSVPRFLMITSSELTRASRKRQLFKSSQPVSSYENTLLGAEANHEDEKEYPKRVVREKLAELVLFIGHVQPQTSIGIVRGRAYKICPVEFLHKQSLSVSQRAR